LLALAGCTSSGGQTMMRDVAALAAMDGRKAGTAAEQRAKDYVRAQLGLVSAETAGNVWALLPGTSSEVIVVGAHVDHLGPGYPGADDNASGVAMLLELARRLSARRGELQRSILFVFFTAEEEGLRGSRAFVAAPPVPLARMTAMVNLDMVGRPLLDQLAFRAPMFLVGIDRDASLGLVGARGYGALRALVDRAFAGDEVVAAEDLPEIVGREIERQSAGRSDSASFEAVGIPSLFFGDGESSDYHSKRDVVEKVRGSLLEQRLHALERTVLALSTAPAQTFARGGSERVRYPRPGLYLSAGILGGVSFGGRGIYGAEASLVYFRPWWFAGVAAEVQRGERIAIGPELGVGPFGLELDMMFTPASRGVAVRPFVSIGLVSIAVRLGSIEGEGRFGELTVSLKYPLFLR
jgi:hypothetical protein